jgi:hypothetical protein
MLAMGLRSSWAVSETSRRCRCWAASSLDSMSFSVTARLCTSSRASGTGRPRGTPVAVTFSAPRRRAAMGRSVEPVRSQLTHVMSSSSAGVPKSSACVTVTRLSLTAS